MAASLLVLISSACGPMRQAVDDGANGRGKRKRGCETLVSSTVRAMELTLRRVQIDEQWKVEVSATLRNCSEESISVNVGFARSSLLRALSLRAVGGGLLYRFRLCPDTDVVSVPRFEKLEPRQEVELEATFDLKPASDSSVVEYCVYYFDTDNPREAAPKSIEPADIPVGQYVADIHLPVFVRALEDGASRSTAGRTEVQNAIALNRVRVNVAVR